MNESKKSSTNPLVFVGIGCLVLIVLISAGSFFAAKYIAKKVVENKTGINIQDLEKGKMTFTDKESGTSMDIGNGKIPENFPSDFPLYPDAKVLSTLSSGQKTEGSGYWLTLSTTDSLDTVASYYKIELEKNGWMETANFSSGENQTITVQKDSLSGNVSIIREPEAKETQIVIILSAEVK